MPVPFYIRAAVANAAESHLPRNATLTLRTLREMRDCILHVGISRGEAKTFADFCEAAALLIEYRADMLRADARRGCGPSADAGRLYHARIRAANAVRAAAADFADEDAPELVQAA